MNKDIEQLISSYIEGDISEKDKIIIDNNIKNNKEFALKVDSIKNIITSLNNTPSISTSKEFLSNLDNKINNSTVDEGGYFFNKNLKLLFGFSSILIVAVLFIFNNMNNDIEINNTYNKNINDSAGLDSEENTNSGVGLASGNTKDTILKTGDEFQINKVDFTK